MAPPFDLSEMTITFFRDDLSPAEYVARLDRKAVVFQQVIDLTNVKTPLLNLSVKELEKREARKRELFFQLGEIMGMKAAANE